MQRLTQAQQELYDWLVEYIRTNQHSPSIRQMMIAMKLRSPAPVQSRLEHLRNKGYISWNEGKARTLRILHPVKQGIPILGTIAAGGLIEPFTDAIDHLVADGDLVFLYPVLEPGQLKNGTIVAARVDGYGTTLKRFYCQGDRVTLKPANSKYKPIEVLATQVQVQGSLVGVWRSY